MPRPKTLSYILDKKTDKLLKVHTQRGADLTMMIPIGTLASFLWAYFLGNMNRYLDGWISLFSKESNVSMLLSSLEVLYFKLLFITSVIFVFIYALWNKHNEKFKKYKAEILVILDAEPCIHKSPCNCVDSYCSWIEKEKGVDLI